MLYYPTVLNRKEMISVIRYTLQDQLFRGSFTQEVRSEVKGSILFETDVLSTLDKDDIKKINKTSKDLKVRLEGEMLIINFLNDKGDVVHTVELDEYDIDNESIIIGIEVVGCKPVE